MTAPIHVVGAAILQGGTCLAAKRSERMSCPGKWEFPGGKVEAGERPEHALRRELVEELGIDTEIGRFVARGVGKVGERTIHLDVYLARVCAGAPAPVEHAEIRFLTAQQLDTLDWADADVVPAQVVSRLLTEDASLR